LIAPLPAAMRRACDLPASAGRENFFGHGRYVGKNEKIKPQKLKGQGRLEYFHLA